jgi:hypothetical protein
VRRHSGNGKQVDGMLVAGGKRQVGKGWVLRRQGKVLLLGGFVGSGKLSEGPGVGGIPVGKEKPVKEPPGAGAIPVNKLVKGVPWASIPVEVEVKSEPKPVNKLVKGLPWESVPTSAEVKGTSPGPGTVDASAEGVKFP